MAEYIIREAVREIKTELGDTEGVRTEREVIGELIRCKDCKNYDTRKCMGRDAFYGLIDDDFCSWAERKKDGKD